MLTEKSKTILAVAVAGILVACALFGAIIYASNNDTGTIDKKVKEVSTDGSSSTDLRSVTWMVYVPSSTEKIVNQMDSADVEMEELSYEETNDSTGDNEIIEAQTQVIEQSTESMINEIAATDNAVMNIKSQFGGEMSEEQLKALLEANGFGGFGGSGSWIQGTEDKPAVDESEV